MPTYDRAGEWGEGGRCYTRMPTYDRAGEWGEGGRCYTRRKQWTDEWEEGRIESRKGGQ